MADPTRRRILIVLLAGGAVPADPAAAPGTSRRVSLAVMPVLARSKRAVAPALGSTAAIADAKQTNLCALLSGVLLVGLGANAALGWWWADSLAGAGIAVLAMVEARRTWSAESLEDTCCS